MPCSEFFMLDCEVSDTVCLVPCADHEFIITEIFLSVPLAERDTSPHNSAHFYFLNLEFNPSLAFILKACLMCQKLEFVFPAYVVGTS